MRTNPASLEVTFLFLNYPLLVHNSSIVHAQSPQIRLQAIKGAIPGALSELQGRVRGVIGAKLDNQSFKLILAVNVTEARGGDESRQPNLDSFDEPNAISRGDVTVTKRYGADEYTTGGGCFAIFIAVVGTFSAVYASLPFL